RRIPEQALEPRPARRSPTLTPGDLTDEVEEPALALCINAPIYGHELVAVLVVAARPGAASAGARVEVAPGGAPAERGHEVVPGLLEVEVVVLVEDDRLTTVAID